MLRKGLVRKNRNHLKVEIFHRELKPFFCLWVFLMSKSIGHGLLLYNKVSQKGCMENNLTYHTLKWTPVQHHRIKQQFRGSVEYEIVERFVMMTGKLLCKHVTFCQMNASGIYNSEIVEVCLWVRTHNTSECAPGQIVGFGGGCRTRLV